jgi:hypothetical protein
VCLLLNDNILDTQWLQSPAVGLGSAPLDTQGLQLPASRTWLCTLGHSRVTVARHSDLALFTLGHPKVTVARQSDWALHRWTLKGYSCPPVKGYCRPPVGLGSAPLDTQGLQLPASRTWLSSHLDTQRLLSPASRTGLCTLGLNNCQFSSRPLFPLLSILPLRLIITNYSACKIVIFFAINLFISWTLKY